MTELLLSVITFNLRRPSLQDGKHCWENRRDLVVELIQQCAPDILGTQEATWEQIAALKEKLVHYEWFGQGRLGDHQDEHVAIFYVSKKFELLDHGDMWLSETPNIPGSKSWGMDLPRMLTWGLFGHVASGRRLYFLNTHVPHRPEDDRARAHCARLIVDFAEELPGDYPIVLVGDFNDVPGSETHRILLEIFLDAFEVALRRRGPLGTFHGFCGGSGGPRIDWILYKGALRALEVETLTHSRADLYPSDHYPVLARLQLL